MTEKKTITCISCPKGCTMKVTLEDGIVSEVKGNSCKKGEKYAIKECTSPTRIVTSTVKVLNGTKKVVSVKTAEDIPKDKIECCMKELEKVRVEAPITEGMVVLADVAHTGVDVVATKSMERREEDKVLAAEAMILEDQAESYDVSLLTHAAPGTIRKGTKKKTKKALKKVFKKTLKKELSASKITMTKKEFKQAVKKSVKNEIKKIYQK